MMTVSQKTLTQMRREIAADNPLLEERLWPVGDVAHEAGFSDLFAAACDGEFSGSDHYRFALEYIFEGYLLHYEKSRLLDPGGADFALLAGDYMYAQGLSRITLLNDPVCIRLLADLVSFCAFVHAEKFNRRLAMEAWMATSVCLAQRATGKFPAGLPGMDRCAGGLARLKEGARAGSGVLDDILLSYPESQRQMLKKLQAAIIQNYA